MLILTAFNPSDGDHFHGVHFRNVVTQHVFNPVLECCRRRWTPCTGSAHVQENRLLYIKKFAEVTPLIHQVLPTQLPDAGFYLWARIPAEAGIGEDTDFTKNLFAATGVTVLPGSFLARETEQGNPGKGYIRIALVDTLDLCVEAAQRIVRFSSPYLS